MFEVCAAVLSFPETAERFWREKEEEGGLWAIVKCAIQWFPCRFEPLTHIVTALASASDSSARQTADVLENLPSVTLEMSRRAFSRDIERKPYERDCLVHRNAYEIPATSQYCKLNPPASLPLRDECEVIMFDARSNYWDAFHHRIELMLLAAGGGIGNLSESNSQLTEQVSLGFGLLEALLGTDVDISPSMVIPTELCFEIVNRFSYPVLPLNIYKVNPECLSIVCRVWAVGLAELMGIAEFFFSSSWE